MASLRQIRRRMKSIENIHEITKAMEMIAAFRFKKAETRFSRSKAYFSEWQRLASNLAASVAENLDHPLFERRAIRKKALLVLTADKGLCGSYNAHLIKAATGWFAAQSADESVPPAAGGLVKRSITKVLIPVGKVGCDHFKKKGMPVLLAYPEKSRADFPMTVSIAEELKRLFLERKIDSVEILYASFRVGGTGLLRRVPFLSLSWLVEDAGREAGRRPLSTPYIFEPDFASVFASVVSKFLQGQLYGILLESLVSEYSARMVAMKQATDNGEEVLDNLKILRNKTRQAVITRELSEIVSGASALV